MADRTCSVDGCEQKHYGRGWCTKHYARWKKYGDPLTVAFVRGDDLSRFWSHVERRGDDDCWLWTAQVSTNGYGHINMGGKQRLAHRVAYELLVGPIPDGMELDHVRARGCRHRHCVNPAHLEPVTRQINTLRSFAPSAINARKTCCIRGHDFTPENTYIYPSGRRECRTCRRLIHRKARR